MEALTEGRPASERAEGYRFLTRITAAMTEFQLEQTADWPSFVQVMSPARKFYVDNPDTLYHRATLDPRLGYRVRGRRGDELYLSFVCTAFAAAATPSSPMPAMTNCSSQRMALSSWCCPSNGRRAQSIGCR